MNCLEMFSGVGGFRLGLERAGFKFDWIGFSEIDKYASEVYKKHFPESEELGDATTIDPDRLPRIDMLMGGFPCQSFSIAGKRKGFEDTRGTLFFDIARIIKAKRPQTVFLENVRGLLSHDNGRTFETIIRVLGELGYIVQWQVLNSKYFGVPQNRERVFIIGHYGKGSFRKVFPIGKSSQRSSQTRGNGELREENIAATLKQRDYKDGTNFIRVHNLQPRSGDPKKGGTGPLSREDGKTYCLDTGNTQGVEIGSRIRRLTPLECERLQGFPDNWTEGHSDTQRYKMCGNAVTVNVIKAIAYNLT